MKRQETNTRKINGGLKKRTENGEEADKKKKKKTRAEIRRKRV